MGDFETFNLYETNPTSPKQLPATRSQAAFLNAAVRFDMHFAMAMLQFIDVQTLNQSIQASMDNSERN